MWNRLIDSVTWALFKVLAWLFPPRPGPWPKDPKLILVFSTTGIGDGLFDSAAIRCLKIAHPSAKLIVCAHRKRRWMAVHNPFVDEVVPYGKSPVHQWKLLHRFRRERPDWVAVLRANPEVLPLAYSINRRAVVAITKRCPKYAFLVTHPVQVKQGLHLVRLTLSVAEYINGSACSPEMVYEVTPDEIADLQTKNARWIGSPYVVFQTGGGRTLSYRDWPVESYVCVIQWMRERWPHQIILTGGTDNLDRANAIEQQCPGVFNLACKTTLAETAALLKLAAMLFTTDTGVMHLGFAVGCRVLCLLHYTNPASAVGPLGSSGKHIAIDLDPPATPRDPAPDDMKGISREQVQQAIIEMLGTPPLR